jgi:hypothetical protein
LLVPSSARQTDRLNDPEDDDDPRSDREMDSHELRDFEDHDSYVPQTSTANLGSFARFLHGLPDDINMTEEEYTKAFEALPLPMTRPPPQGISIQEGIQASRYTSYAYQVGCRV